LRQLPVVTQSGAQIVLGDVADLGVSEGPPGIKSENGRLAGWIYVDLRGRDLRSAVHEMQQTVAREIVLPPGMSVSWSGQFEYLERATERLKIVVPFTLVIIFVLLYTTFRSTRDALVILSVLPFSLIGGFWLIYLAGHNLSVASAVGFIALAGVAAEFGVVMLIYLNHALERRLATGAPRTRELVLDAIREGAALRVRPKAMTVAVILAGLMPIMLGHGTGSEVMKRIAAPMVGGMVTAPLLSMLLIPATFLLLHAPRREGSGRRRGLHASAPALAKRVDAQGD
jgi:Cu(I)/Ag(I) efflux system membrane protein CusA/SilA